MQRAELRDRAADGFEKLAHWSVAALKEPIPAATMRQAALVLIDDIAAIAAASNEPEVIALREALSANTRVPEATIFCGNGGKLDRVDAALCNAIAGNWCELDPGYRKVGCHAGIYILPALMAEAEAEGIRFGDLLRIFIVAYEIVARVGQCWYFPAPRPTHPHATFSALGAAAALGLARGLDAELLHRALTVSATLHSTGPYPHVVEGATVRNCWAGEGAESGFRAITYARAGIGGLPTSLFDVYSGILGGEASPDLLADGLGDSWAIDDGYHKEFSCCQLTHATVEALLSLRQTLPREKKLSDIESVTVETHSLALALVDTQPSTTLGGRFSLPHVASAALLRGHAGPEAFAADTLSDTAIAALRDKVLLREYEPPMDWPNDRPSRVTVSFVDGDSYTDECLSARGGRDRPFSPDEILAKASKLTAGVFPNFGTVATGLLDVDETTSATAWRDVVSEITAAV